MRLFLSLSDALGYWDRFTGMQEIPFCDFRNTHDFDIPFHRVYYFTTVDNRLLWDRETNFDGLKGWIPSKGSSLHLEPWEKSLEKAGFETSLTHSVFSTKVTSGEVAIFCYIHLKIVNPFVVVLVFAVPKNFLNEE